MNTTETDRGLNDSSMGVAELMTYVWVDMGAELSWVFCSVV